MYLKIVIARHMKRDGCNSDLILSDISVTR
jgi:hypothetical protein